MKQSERTKISSPDFVQNFTKPSFIYKIRNFKSTIDAKRISISQKLIKERPLNWNENPKINEFLRNNSRKSAEVTQAHKINFINFFNLI